MLQIIFCASVKVTAIKDIGTKSQHNIHHLHYCGSLSQH